MTDLIRAALVVVAAFALAVTVFAVNHRRARRRDDLMALHDAVNPTFHDYEIEALRALFHADQNPQPSRRKR